MNPHLSDDFDRAELDPLARRLHEGARHAVPAPSPELRGRILATLRATPRVELAATRRPRLLGTALAVAAAVLALLSAWWLTRPAAVEPARAPSLVAVTHELLGTRARVLALPERAERDLRLEAERLWRDTAFLAGKVARGLPATLRASDERL